MEPNKSNTALLVMDVQQITVAMLGAAADSYLANIAIAIKKARANNMPVIYVVIGFRPGYPEVGPSSKMFSAIKNNPAYKLDTGEAAKVHVLAAPAPEDIIVTKKRVSAFAGSDLEVLLRSMGVNHIILSGIATSGVVLSTLCEASDKDYAITVLSDGCADLDEEVHRVLTTKVFLRHANVLTIEKWGEM
jgi:nicotinamidase-related amidase